MRARNPLAPVPGSPASYRTTDLGGKVKKMCENPGIPGCKTGEVNNLSYQSEGFPRTRYFIPVCVELAVGSSKSVVARASFCHFHDFN